MYTTEKFIQIWENASEKYNRLIQRELSSNLRDKWLKLILEHSPKKTPLRILDIGCGPGFFSIILSQEGHTVTGIDICPKMIHLAKENAEKEHVEPDFFVMDADKLIFRDYTFDLIVTRNVIYSLADPERVYTEIKRLLRPLGRLLVFDANWMLKYCDQDLAICIENDRDEYVKTFHENPSLTFDVNVFEPYRYSMPLAEVQRPLWDEKILHKLGYVNIKTVEDISHIVYDEKRALLFRSTPIFMISATKAKNLKEENDEIQDFWKKQSESILENCMNDLHEAKRNAWSDIIDNYLPRKKNLRILVAGCGSGFLAILMALKGHEVVGVDYSCAMIARAIENAKKANALVTFLCSQIDAFPFENEYFDVILSRNVVWNLPNPELAFSEWRRVLAPGGRLMYFDGNWHLPFFDKEELASYNILSTQTDLSHYEQKDMLPLSRVYRPEWDQLTLPKWGFEPLYVKCDVSEELWNEDEKLRFFATPFFMIVAEKIRGFH